MTSTLITITRRLNCCTFSIFLVLMTNLSLVAFSINSHAEEPSSCIPDCRAGYFCHQGQCISKCNPLCDEGQICGANGECSDKNTTAVIPSSPQVTPVQPATPVQPVTQPTTSSQAPRSPAKTLRERAQQHTEELMDPVPQKVDRQTPAPEKTSEEEYKSSEPPPSKSESSSPKKEKVLDLSSDEDNDSMLYIKISGGIMGGITLPALLYLPNQATDAKTRGGLAFRGYVDRKFSRAFSSGLYLNIFSLPIISDPMLTLPPDLQVVSFGVNFKLRNQLNPQTELRVGFGIGGQLYGNDQIEQKEEMTNDTFNESSRERNKGSASLDVLGTIEGAFKLSKRMSAVGALSLSAQVTRNADRDMLWRPIILLSAGIEFH